MKSSVSCFTSIRSQVATVAGCWLLVALFVGELRLLSFVPGPLVQVILLIETALLLAAFWRIPGFRQWVFDLDVRWLVAVHLTRFVGIYFLVLHARGELPYAFAVPGGWGDIAVAVGASLLLMARTLIGGGAYRHALLVWNVVGLADILFVVAAAARLGVANPDSMRALLGLPLSLLPTFVVPLIIASHAFLFVRLAHPNRTGK